MDNLKPCPFCGSEHVSFHEGEEQLLEDTTTGFIWCHGCDFSSDSFYSEGVATEKWNRRAEPVNTPLTQERFEQICEAVHNGWWEEKKRQGVTDHPDMIPYHDLSEPVKEYDRVTVRRVLDALGVAYQPADK